MRIAVSFCAVTSSVAARRPAAEAVQRLQEQGHAEASAAIGGDDAEVLDAAAADAVGDALDRADVRCRRGQEPGRFGAKAGPVRISRISGQQPTRLLRLGKTTPSSSSRKHWYLTSAWASSSRSSQGIHA